MSCQLNDIGCTEEQLTNSTLFRSPANFKFHPNRISSSWVPISTGWPWGRARRSPLPTAPAAASQRAGGLGRPRPTAPPRLFSVRCLRKLRRCCRPFDSGRIAGSATRVSMLASVPSSSPELIGSLKLGNVWVFLQLCHRPTRTKNQLY